MIVSSTASSLSFPSLSRYFPVVVFFTTNVIPPCFSSSVRSPVKVFSITKSAFSGNFSYVSTIFICPAVSAVTVTGEVAAAPLYVTPWNSYPSTSVSVSVTVYSPTGIPVNVFVNVFASASYTNPSLIVSLTTVSLVVPSALSHFPSEFCTVKYSAPSASASVRFSLSKLFSMIRLPFSSTFLYLLITSTETVPSAFIFSDTTGISVLPSVSSTYSVEAVPSRVSEIVYVTSTGRFSIV